MSETRFVQLFDSVPQFWQFIRGLRIEDLLVELVQNELDANATRTSITFTPDRLICQGDGEPVSEAGWRRLSRLAGAGDQVDAKRFSIGVKNHGLKACFRLGDDIIVRSDGRQTIQTLYMDGDDSPPSPGALPEPDPDYEAPLTGCSVEVPYRRKDLVVPKGESLTLRAPGEEFLTTLFRSACEFLPNRLMGVVRPGIRDRYTLLLSHHIQGSVEFRWRAKRGRNVRGKNRRRFLVFGRECSTSSDVPSVVSSTFYEQACTFRVPFPTGKRPEMPTFYERDKNAFLAEVAWTTDKWGKLNPTTGVRRYPIGYDTTSESALTGVGVHFSAPYVSDSERHGTSQVDSLNHHIDDACKDALVDVMASYLLHRHGGKAMELYLTGPGGSDDEALSELVKRTLDRRALPLAGKALRASTRLKRVKLGPRKTSSGDLRRIVLPMLTWARDRISPHLSEICPNDEDQIDRTVPSPILSYLGRNCYQPNDGFDGLVTTFDEHDAIQRLQPQNGPAQFFPWKDESEWQAALGNPSVARTYLDVAYKAVQEDELESGSEVRENTYLPDARCTAQPLADMFNAVNLPPNLEGQQYVPILHRELQDHLLLKKRAWKPRSFTLEDFLAQAQLETASLAKRKLFWTWLRDNWKTVKRPTLIRLSALPVWPSSNDTFLPLDSLCEPRTTRVATIMGKTIGRPSHELLETGIVRMTGRGRLAFRNVPTNQEFESFLESRMERFPWERQLTPNEKHEFHKFEKDLANLLSSVPRLKEHLEELSEEYAGALDRDGNLRDPSELVRDEGPLQDLHLLNQCIIDRPKCILDRIDGWRPQATPSTDQIVATLRRDAARVDAHIPRLQEYARRAKQEGIQADGLVDVSCIPIGDELFRPSEISLPGQRNFWGGWKVALSVTGISAEVQRLYKTVGVVGGAPDSISSRLFFGWLASQSIDTITEHVDQILRHIGHKFGPSAWSAEFPGVPWIPVESDDGRLQLVNRAEATRSRSKVVIPDFESLAEAIRQRPGKRPVSMAILETRRVTRPITTHLRDIEVRSLAELAGEPTQVFGQGGGQPTCDLDLSRILTSLISGAMGKQLRKRLAKLGLDTPQNGLRNNWRDRLSNIWRVRVADSVTASYKLGRKSFSIAVDGELDKSSGTLWLTSESDLQASFFDVIAPYIFDHPPKYYGSVLDRAYKMDMKEHYPLEYAADVESPEDDDDLDVGIANDEGGDTLAETAGVHPIPQPDPSKNVPKPGPIPTGSGTIKPVKKAPPGTTRPQSTEENAQIDDLKEKQYAWHCQACVAGKEPRTLAPLSSYAAITQNRSPMMQAHHCDHVNAGGARHAGNILLLCRYHHLAFGDAVSRVEVIQALGQARIHRLTFGSDNGVTNTLEGKVVTVHPPQRPDSISLFFTTTHANYWLAKAGEEGLV